MSTATTREVPVVQLLPYHALPVITISVVNKEGHEEDIDVIGMSDMDDLLGEALQERAHTQREWDYTVGRIKEIAEVLRVDGLVEPQCIGGISIRKTEVLDLLHIEHILFENLLIEPRMRVDHYGMIEFSLVWRTVWRKFVRFEATRMRVNDEERQHYAYRFNLIDVEMTQ